MLQKADILEAMRSCGQEGNACRPAALLFGRWLIKGLVVKREGQGSFFHMELFFEASSLTEDPMRTLSMTKKDWEVEPVLAA